MSRLLFAVVAGVLPTGAAAAPQADDSGRRPAGDSLHVLATTAPLFASHDVLNLTLEGPLQTVFREREQESAYHPAVLVATDTSGIPTRLDVQIKTRGKNRLQRSICGFPPLRVKFRRRQAAATAFASQDRLKLVTHCQDRRDEYEQYVLLEHLIYRTYNLLTDLSFRVRLVRISYVDLDAGGKSLSKYAFFIEDDELMAARNGWWALQVPWVDPAEVDTLQVALLDLFQYMIGHADYSAFRPESDKDECCHNVKLIGTPAGPVFPVPYDFDGSGVVAARYAVPDPRLRVRSVRDRVYRGFCRPREYLDSAVAVILNRREAIVALHRAQQQLEDRYLKRTLDYYEGFYEIAENPRAVDREFMGACRKLR